MLEHPQADTHGDINGSHLGQEEPEGRRKWGEVGEYVSSYDIHFAILLYDFTQKHFLRSFEEPR